MKQHIRGAPSDVVYFLYFHTYSIGGCDGNDDAADDAADLSVTVVGGE